MHDGIEIEQRGLPAATICTTLFESTSRASAAACGRADYPVIYTEHPISNGSEAALRARGAALADAVEQVLLAR